MIRREDWPERLNAHIDLRRATPFGWGIQDCVTFAAGAVEAMTDADLLVGLPAWGSREAAERLIIELSGGTGLLAAAIEARLGPPIDAWLARRGDVVLVDVGQVAALGVCLGAYAAAPGPSGLEWVDARHWRAAWRIG